MACDYCTDGGESGFPIYGMAPHKHVGESFIGSTVLLPNDEWPDNFVEDAECPGMGMWFCPECREGL